MDARLDTIDGRLHKVNANLEALPRALAEIWREGKTYSLSLSMRRRRNN